MRSRHARVWHRREDDALLSSPDRRHHRGPGAPPHPCLDSLRLWRGDPLGQETREERYRKPGLRAAHGLLVPALHHSSRPGVCRWAATSRPAWRLTARPALENQGADATGALGICRRRPPSPAVGLKNHHRPMKMLDMCLWAVVRSNSLILLLIHNKSLKKNFQISSAPDQKRWAFAGGLDGELCFEE